MFEVRALSAGYDGRAVLQGIDLGVSRGDSVCVIGPNGAGKTTLLRCLAGLLPPRAGSVRLHDEEVSRLRPAARVARGLALVPEGRHVFGPLTVAENLEMGAFRWLWPRRDRRVAADLAAVLDLFPRLRERLGQTAGTLSGGEQQMLAIGRALMSRPRVLLLDEPSVGLAPLLIEEIAAALRRLVADGVALLLAEQNAGLAAATTARGYVLANGSIVRSGSSQNLLADPLVLSAYLGP